MYSYNNMPKYSDNMYYDNNNFQNPNDDRFFAGGFIGPLLLGGVAGYAIGNNNRPNYYYPQPYIPIQPQPYYTTNNNYYYPYY